MLIFHFFCTWIPGSRSVPIRQSISTGISHKENPINTFKPIYSTQFIQQRKDFLMQKNQFYKKVTILGLVIVSTAAMFGLISAPYAAQITADESNIVDLRDEEAFGPLPYILTSFARCTDPDDILPEGDQITWSLPSLFDTGAEKPGIIDNFGNSDNPGVFIGEQIANAIGLPYDSSKEVVVDPDPYWDPVLEETIDPPPEVVPNPFYHTVQGSENRCLNLFMNGVNAINLSTLTMTNDPPPAEIPGVLPKITAIDDGKLTLVAIPVVKRVRALMDARPDSTITFEYTDEGILKEFTGPSIVFNPSNVDMESGPVKVTLGLYRILDDNPLTSDRWQIDPLVLRNNGLSYQSDPGSNTQFLYDTGTKFTAVSRNIANELGLLVEDPDFICNINGNPYEGHVIDSVEMQGFVGERQNLEDTYVVKNARICIEDDDPGTPRIIKSPGDHSTGDYQAVIGSNLFEQVKVLLDGPRSTLTILTDPGDLDGNLCVDRNDRDLLLAELNKPVQSVHIQGYAEAGSLGIISGEAGPAGNFTYVEFTADGPVEISEVSFDFTGTNVIADADGYSILNAQGCCEDSFQRTPNPFDIDSQIVGFTTTGFGSDNTFTVGWDFDIIPASSGGFSGDSNIPSREAYYGGTVTVTFSDGSTVSNQFNALYSSVYARNNSSAATAFFLDISDFQEPPRPDYDVNGDNIVDQDDLQALELLFDNSNGDPCFDSGGPVDPLPSGDVDGDGDIDRDDILELMAARNTPADGPDDPRDLDGDGMITVLDARKCVLLCTRPRCATE